MWQMFQISRSDFVKNDECSKVTDDEVYLYRMAETTKTGRSAKVDGIKIKKSPGVDNGSQLKNLGISGAIFTLSLGIKYGILNV